MNPFFKTTLLAASALPVICQAASIRVQAVNPLDLSRASETLELSATDLALLGNIDFTTVHVKDSSGIELICQAIDLDGDPLRKHDAVIFQADFAPLETKTFTVFTGKKQVHTKDQHKAYARFVRERFDDFAWENDRVAHRTYGKALETWEAEPLTSSTIDIWSKRTPRMVINDWYMTDDYHADHGEGADFYSAGLSRGCGGSALWAADRLWFSRNFVESRVLANGPIRVSFELDYAPYEMNHLSVSETKRVSLDAGHQFNRFESRYKRFSRPGPSVELTTAVGLKKAVGESLNAAAGNLLIKWEPVEKNAGQQGLAVIVRPESSSGLTDDPLNHFILTKADPQNVATWWAGFCWDKAGHFTDENAWKQHVEAYAQGLENPIKVIVSADH